MKERDILQKIKDFVHDFDQRAAKAVKKVVLPATLGLGLVLAPGCGPDEDLSDRARTTEQRGKGDTPGPGSNALYAAPFPGTLDSGGPSALYAAPFPDAGPPDAGDAGSPDAGDAATDAGPAETCVSGGTSYCGTQAPAGCYCDTECLTNDDCCDDHLACQATALYAAPFPEPDPD